MTTKQPDGARKAQRVIKKYPNRSLYGTDARNIGVYSDERRLDRWTGMTNSPVAVTLSDKSDYIDLSVPVVLSRWAP